MIKCNNNKNIAVEDDNTKVFFKVRSVEDTIEGTIKKSQKDSLCRQLKIIKNLVGKDHKIKKMLNLKCSTHFF